MLTNFNRLNKAATVAALTLGVTFAQPAQKASAQSIPTIRGGGSSSVTNLLSSLNSSVKDYVQDPANSPTGTLPAFDYSNGYIELALRKPELLPEFYVQLAIAQLECSVYHIFVLPAFLLFICSTLSYTIGNLLAGRE